MNLREAGDSVSALPCSMYLLNHYLLQNADTCMHVSATILATYQARSQDFQKGGDKIGKPSTEVWEHTPLEEFKIKKHRQLNFIYL